MKNLNIIILAVLIPVLIFSCSEKSTDQAGNGDTTPPEVVSTNPPGDDPQSEVSVLSSIEIDFSEELDCNSVDESMIDIGTSRSGTVTCSGNKVLFDPDLAFDFGVLVQVTVKAGIKDTAGNGMAEDYVFQFYTEVEPGR